MLEFQLYLSDRKAPMLVAEAVCELLDGPPARVAREIEAWTAAQYQGAGAAIPVSDYLFHALKKIHLLAEFGLVRREVLLPRLGAVARALEPFCPEEDRLSFRESVTRLGEARTVAAAAQVETLYRQVGSDRPDGARPRRAEGAGASSDEGEPGELTRALRRFNTLLGRVAPSPGAGSPVLPEQQRQTVEGDLLAAAAASARTAAELEGYLQRLKGAGFDVPREGMMRALGNALPEWGVLLGPEAADGTAVEGPRGLVGAMGHLVSLAGTPEEGARRFHEMVEVAVELFEEGSLPRAVTVFEVADRIVRKEKVATPLVASVKEQAQRGLSPARLKGYAEKPEQHLPLRRVLDFFPALSPKGLLSALREERKREGRRLLLALLEVHGPAARQAALEEVEQLLERGTAGDEWHFLRNLLYVVRHGSDGPLDLSDFETDCVARLSETTLPPGLVKEAVATLALVRGEKAVAALLLRLAQLEEALLRADLAPEARTETESLVDRTVAALVRQGTPRALSAVVEHGLKTNPLLGNTRARLATLSTEDLSVDEESAQRLVRELRSVLPLRVLGFVIQKTKVAALPLVTALSGTPTPAVRKLFEEIARRFPDVDFGQAAAAALTAFEARSREGTEKGGERGAEKGGEPSLSGDLGIFGFPTLIQTLEQSRATGVLTLRGTSGADEASLRLVEGRLSACSVAGLRGTEAFFRVLERPEAGTFRFEARAAASPEDAALETPRDILPLLMEGMARHDELCRATALVPDASRLAATGTRPTAHPEEEDGSLVRGTWTRVLAGATPLECEGVAPVAPFRVRRLLAHWVSEGSLRLAGPERGTPGDSTP